MGIENKRGDKRDAEESPGGVGVSIWLERVGAGRVVFGLCVSVKGGVVAYDVGG